MNKVPTIAVPVHIYLDLIRAYKEQPQEVLNRTIYLEATTLERRAYRKYLAYKKERGKNNEHRRLLNLREKGLLRTHSQ